MKQQNQQLTQRKTRQDKQGNVRYRVFHKDGTSTMLFASGLTKESATVLEKWLRQKVSQLSGTLNGIFITVK